MKDKVLTGLTSAQYPDMLQLAIHDYCQVLTGLTSAQYPDYRLGNQSEVYES